MKKQLFLKMAAVAVVMGGVIVSCESEKTPNVLPEQAEVIDPSNPANPYDFIGQIHNEGLSKTMTEVYASTKTLNADEIISISSKHSSELLFSNDQTRGVSIDELETMTGEEILAMLEDMDNNLDNFINELELTPAAKAEFKGFVTSFLAAPYDSDPDKAYSMMYNKVVSFENTLLSQQTAISSMDQMALLSGSSTLRHSLAYWSDTYGQEELASSSAAPKRKWWKWLIIGLSDAAGATGGAIAGTALGGVGGGIAGGITGGVSASGAATTWVDKL